MSGVNVLIQDDLRRCVVFIGTHADKSKGGISCVGTGFLLEYEMVRYLVTVQHIATGLGDAPFVIRLNRKDGSADNIHVDPIEDNVRWYSKMDDPDLDLAIMPFNYSLQAAGYESLFLHSKGFLGQLANVPLTMIGIGDLTYTVGLFQLVAGQKRNLPVVHSGSVALLAGQEKIPVDDWHASGKVRYVDCHLVETHSLKGLSGAPVFARGSMDFLDLPIADGQKMSVRIPCRDVSLFGVWQGSWDAPPGSVLGVKDGYGNRVPVGMGVVIPSERIIELLETDTMKKQRAGVLKQRNTSNAASLDSIPPPDAYPPANELHPNGRERFNSLLRAATQKRESED